jgi:hypothetical protein
MFICPLLLSISSLSRGPLYRRHKKEGTQNQNNQIMFIISEKEIKLLPHEFAFFDYSIQRQGQLHVELKPQFVLLQCTDLVNQLDAFLAKYSADCLFTHGGVISQEDYVLKTAKPKIMYSQYYRKKSRISSLKYMRILIHIQVVSRDNVVSMTTGYGLDDRGVSVRIPVGPRIFSTSSGPALRPTQPPIQWVLEVLSPRLKQAGRQGDHSPPASAEVKEMWIYTSTLPYAFMVYCLIS